MWLSIRISLGLVCYFSATVAFASLPHVDSERSYTMVLAALSETSSESALRTKLRDFRVKRPSGEDYEFADAVLALIFQNIGVENSRESTIGLLNTATPGQKALFAVQLMRITVADLGFIGYLESTTGDLIPEVERGLTIIGAKEYLKLFKRAVKIFKKEKRLITSAHNRKEVLARLSNEKRYELYDPMDERFETLEDKLVLQNYIIKYVNNNPRHFFLK